MQDAIGTVQVASYLRRVLDKARLIFSRINGPIVASMWFDSLPFVAFADLVADHSS